jgi:hypothetical protein
VLPDFPQLKTEIGKRAQQAIEQRVREKAPIMAEIPRHAQYEGTIHTYDRIEADPVSEGFEVIGIPVTVDIAEVPELSGALFGAKIDAIAEQMAQKQMDLFYRKHSQAAAEVGNAFDAGGAPLTPDLFFKMLENVHMEFGPGGELIGQFVTSEPIAKIMNEWQKDPAFLARYEELLNRKRDDWRNRESNRKLVD